MSILNKATQLMLITILVSTSLQSVFAMQSNLDAQQALTSEELHQLGLQLVEAAGDGNLDAVNDLISRGADVNIANNYGDTALHLAARKNRINIVNTLLDRGAEVNAGEGWTTPLHLAAHRGHILVVNTLLRRGAEVNLTDKDGFTALHWAARKGHSDIVNLLLDCDAQVNQVDKYGMTLLHWAVIEGQTDIVIALLGRGAKVNQTNNRGQAPLYRAAEGGNAEIVKLLERERDFPLHSAAALGHTERVRNMLRNGADIHQVDDEGKMPIELAANNAIRILLKERAALPFYTLRRENPDFPMDLIKLTSEFMGPGSSSAFEGMY